MTSPFKARNKVFQPISWLVHAKTSEFPLKRPKLTNNNYYIMYWAWKPMGDYKAQDHPLHIVIDDIHDDWKQRGNLKFGHKNSEPI